MTHANRAGQTPVPSDRFIPILAIASFPLAFLLVRAGSSQRESPLQVRGWALWQEPSQARELSSRVRPLESSRASPSQVRVQESSLALRSRVRVPESSS